jgi:RNA polymerase sigma-70 factor, ECF subfamily
MKRPTSKKRRRPSSAELSRWFHRAQQGEEGALQQLLALYRPLLLKLAQGQVTGALRRKVPPSDLVQTTVWNATRDFSPDKFDNRTAFLAWLTKILENEASTARRRYLQTKKRDISREQPLFAPQTQDWLVQLSASLSVSDAAEAHRAQSIARVQAALRRLPAHYQLVLRLRYYEKLNFHSIAEQLERSYDGVRMLHNRALNRLAKELPPAQEDSS